MVKNGGVWTTERLFPQNVKCSDSFFLASRLSCGANLIFAASFTLKGHDADLFPTLFPGVFASLNTGFDL